MVRGACEEGAWGCVISAIVWIARPCVAHCVVGMIMKCLNVKCVNPFSLFYVEDALRVKVW